MKPKPPKKWEGFTFRCNQPNCNKRFDSFGGIRGHLRWAHMINNATNEMVTSMATKNSGDTNMNESEIKTPIESKTLAPTLDLREVTDKLNKLEQMIPQDFCREFPNLCKIGERVENLEGILNSIKSSIPKEIKISIPKSVEPKILDYAPILTQVGKDIEDLKKISTNVLDETKNIDTKLNTQTQEKQSKIIAPKTHTKAEDYLECPECREKMFKALEKKLANSSDLDDTTKEFISTLKTKLQEKIDDEPKTNEPKVNEYETSGIDVTNAKGRSDSEVRNDGGTVESNKQSRNPEPTSIPAEGQSERSPKYVPFLFRGIKTRQE